MGGNTSRGDVGGPDAVDKNTDDVLERTLTIKSRQDVMDWKTRLELKLKGDIEKEARKIYEQESTKQVGDGKGPKRKRGNKAKVANDWNGEKIAKMSKIEKSRYDAAMKLAAEKVTRVDDGVREMSVMYKMAPKDANEIRRCIAMTSSLISITIRKHIGGPALGYRDDVSARVMLAIGKMPGESQTLRSMDVSNCEVGGSKSGGVDKFGNKVIFDLSSITAGSAVSLLRGLAESKKKPVGEGSSLKRLTLRKNNLTSWGFHYRPVGVALRGLLSGPGRITSVDLSSCELGPDCVAHALHHGIAGIERINFSNNHIGGRYGNRENPLRWYDDNRGIFARALAKALAGETGEFGRDLGNGMCSLRSLDLSSNRLSSKSAIIIAKGISANGTLRSLSFAFNQGLGDDGATALIEAAGSDKSNLEMLDLRGCGIRAFGIFAAKKLAGKLQNAEKTAKAEIGVDDYFDGETEEEHKAREKREDEEAAARAEHARSRKLVVDLSANDVNTDQLPKSHGDSRVRFVTDSWRHLVGGQTNVATMDQIRSFATEFVISGAKFERRYKRQGRLGLHLVSSKACPDVVQQLCSAVVSQTVRGSPSQPKRGRQIAVGSLLTHINGVPTAGMTLSETIERLKLVRGKKEAWAIPTIPPNFEKLHENERDSIEKARDNALRDAGDTTLRFMGKLIKGPPRLKRRKPGSRRPGSRDSQSDRINSRSLDVLASVGARKLSEKQKEVSNEREEKARIEQEKAAALLKEQQRIAAGGLPDGWQVAYDDWGSPYYWNINTGETSWERPGDKSNYADEPDKALALLQQLSEEQERQERTEAAAKAQKDDLELLELEALLAD